jgi:cell division transport system permease protein
VNDSFSYFIREALHQAWRQRMLTLVAASALALAALSGGAWALLWRNQQAWTRDLAFSAQIAVFLKPGLAPEAQQAAATAALSLSGVASAELVTPQQAAMEMSRDPEIKTALSLLPDNPLPAALKVRLSAETQQQAADVETRLKALDGVDSVDATAGAVEGLLKTAEALKTVLLAAAAAFSAAALLIVAAVLRLAAWTRREEISIMRLVGAGHGFIRAPFLIEGLFQGLLGGAAASVALMGLQAFLLSTFQAELGVDLRAFLPEGMDLGLALMLTAAAGLLGLLGVALALATLPVAFEDEAAR